MKLHSAFSLRCGRSVFFGALGSTTISFVATIYIENGRADRERFPLSVAPLQLHRYDLKARVFQRRAFFNLRGVGRFTSFSRKPALRAIWFSFMRRASRDRFAAMLFFLRRAQYLSSFRSSGTNCNQWRIIGNKRTLSAYQCNQGSEATTNYILRVAAAPSQLLDPLTFASSSMKNLLLL